MDIKEALDCMNSDYKLWEKAESKDLGGGRVEKTLHLPWGIGEVSVTLEGMSDAGKRRAAVSGYGEYIRGVVNEAISDEAVSARAKQAAARVEQRDSEDSVIVGGGTRVRDAAVQAPTDAEAGEAHEGNATKPVGLRETLLARRSEIEDEAEFYVRRKAECERELKRLARDSRAVEAGIDALGDDDDE